MPSFSSYTMYPDFIIESLFLLSDGFGKVKAKYIALYLNSPAKFQKAKEASYHPALMGNTRLLIACISRINPVNELLLVSSSWYAGQDMLWSRGRCLSRRMET